MDDLRDGGLARMRIVPSLHFSKVTFIMLDLIYIENKCINTEKTKVETVLWDTLY